MLHNSQYSLQMISFVSIYMGTSVYNTIVGVLGGVRVGKKREGHPPFSKLFVVFDI